MRIIAGDQQGEDWFAAERKRLESKQPAPIQLTKKLPSQPSADPAIPGTKGQSKPRGERKQPQPEPAQDTIKQKYTDLPKVGDRFEGIVFDVNAKQIFLEIPGLDPDQTAYAVLNRSESPLLAKVVTGKRLICRVISLSQESPGYWQISCRLDQG